MLEGRVRVVGCSIRYRTLERRVKRAMVVPRLQFIIKQHSRGALSNNY